MPAHNLVSFFGIFILMAVAWLLSTDRKRVGGTATLVPSRTKDISAIGMRALIAATLDCLMTAAVAGTFFTESSILLGSQLLK